ncbi:MAG: hypothetical protein FNNCIFGK_01599 [Bacteroidia bacterium]|nr:hypothetical protein [Bacteroidia bacterium]
MMKTETPRSDHTNWMELLKAEHSVYHKFVYNSIWFLRYCNRKLNMQPASQYKTRVLSKYDLGWFVWTKTHHQNPKHMMCNLQSCW